MYNLGDVIQNFHAKTSFISSAGIRNGSLSFRCVSHELVLDNKKEFLRFHDLVLDPILIIVSEVSLTDLHGTESVMYPVKNLKAAQNQHHALRF